MVDINKYKYVKQLEGEIWKGVPGYENYEVSNMGRVRSLDHYTLRSGDYRSTFVKGRILTQCLGKVGYYNVLLYPADSPKAKRKLMKVHRLVASAFLSNPLNLPEVNHIDEDKTNNNLKNLEYCDRLYNSNWGTAQERKVKSLLETYEKNARRVVQYTEDGEVVAVYKHIRDASQKTGYGKSGIALCCGGFAQRNYGYVFKYEGDPFVKPQYETPKYFKPVVCLTKDGEYVCEYPTADDAGRSFGKKKSGAIAHCLKGRNPSAYGYKWMYADDYYKKNNI